MKKLLYAGSVLTIATSFLVVNHSTYAAHPTAKLIDVQLCSSTPVGVPADAHLAKGIFHGAELATQQWRSKFSKVGLNLLAPMELDYARADGSGTDPAKEHSNALRCVGSKTTYGYDGTLNSSIAKVTEPITNQSGMAMISPSNSAPELTAPSFRQTYEPYTYNHKLKYVTYYRTVTTDALQGPAGAYFMAKILKAKSYYLVDDGQTYGVGLANHLKGFNTSGHLGMKLLGTGRVDSTSSSSISTTSDAISTQVAAKNPSVLYCGCNLENAYLLARDARRKGFRGSIMAGDAIFDVTWIKDVGASGAKNNFATFVGPNPSASSKSFLTSYKRMFPGFDLGPYDAASYDAASIMLNAIYQAKKAGKFKGSLFQRRSSILPYIATVKWHGALGLTTFDHNGDTFNRIISVFQVKGSNWAFKQQLQRELPNFLKPTG